MAASSGTPGGVPSLLSPLSESPRNGEAHFRELMEPITPSEAFYLRSNFPTPDLNPEVYRLDVVTLGRLPTSLSLADLRDLAPEVTRVVTLECAGNGRTLLTPQPDGTPWTLGAVGTATFTGIPLSAVLPSMGTAVSGDLADTGGEADSPTEKDDAAGRDGPVEILFTGHDRGHKQGFGVIPFQRALPAAHLLDTRGTPAEPLLAWQMNGEALHPEHGGPLRLVVPGWYAVASVKWLGRIELLDSPFSGYFQTDRYRYLWPDGSIEPVTRIRVRALLLQVGGMTLDQEGGELQIPAGPHQLRGNAWSGSGAIQSVEVSVDGGATWMMARLDPPAEPHGRTLWDLPWDAEPGQHSLVIRATDAAGNSQALEQVWNALGYGNNVVQRVAVRVD